MKNLKKYSALDVSSYFIRKGVSPLKLQKLLYYSQLWFFVKNRKYLFIDPIRAWIFGPVIPDVWDCFRFIKRTDIIPYKKAYLVDLVDIKSHLDDVWNAYGDLRGSELVDLTHKEKPWLINREGLLNDQPSKREVTIDDNTVSEFKLNSDNTIPKVIISDESFGHFSNF